jgi:hypothetical protein
MACDCANHKIAGFTAITFWRDQNPEVVTCSQVIENRILLLRATCFPDGPAISATPKHLWPIALRMMKTCRLPITLA